MVWVLGGVPWLKMEMVYANYLMVQGKCWLVADGYCIRDAVTRCTPAEV